MSVQMKLLIGVMCLCQHTCTCTHWQCEKLDVKVNLGRIMELECTGCVLCMYNIYRNSVVRLRNIYTSSIILTASKRAFLWRFNVTGKIETYRGFRYNGPEYLPYFYQIEIFSKGFHKSSQLQTSPKSIQLERC